MSFFNALFKNYSSFQEKVEAACDEKLESPDILASIEICDVVNGSKEAAKECMVVLTDCMQDKRPRVALLAMELLDTVVKNCGFKIYGHVAKQDFLDELVKVANKASRVRRRRGDSSTTPLV
jgi:growth factor-regulated tyrosine kinase substrate